MTAQPPRRDPDEPDVRLLLEAARVTSELTLDGVLERLVEIAGRLVGARYVALGVLEAGGAPGLRTFVHHGMDATTVDRIGQLPRGRGLLGVLVDEPVPVRLRDLGEHPDSVGFPAHHPPMASFLGVPVRVRGRVFGNLYLAEKRGPDGFTDRDEEVAVALAATAGVAIENAVLHEEAHHRERWLRASAEVTTDLVASLDLGASLRLVLDRARGVAAADVGWIVTGETVDTLSVTALVGMEPEAVAVGLRASLDRTLTRQVALDGRSVVVGDLGSDPRARLPDHPSWPPLGPAVLVPLRPGAGGVGVLALAWRPHQEVDPDRLDPALLAGFAEQAALALEVARGRDERQRLALLEDRDRIARDLHDVVLQRLFAVGLGLESLSRRVADEQVEARLSEAIEDLDTTIVEVRRAIFNLGRADAAADVQAEVSRMVDRAAATLKVRPSLVFEGPVGSGVGPELAPDVVATLAEALSNAARHAQARRVDVRLRADGDAVTLTVTDDGVGLAVSGAQGGLTNLRERAERHGGSLRVGPAPGGGTRLEWSVPRSG